MAQHSRLRLGDLLVQRGLISSDQLRIALAEQRSSGQRLGKQLVALGFLTESTLRDVLSETLGQHPVDLTQVVADTEAIRLIDRGFATQHQLLPIAYRAAEARLTVAMVNPGDTAALDGLRRRLRDHVRVEMVLAAEGDLLGAIDRYYGYELSIDGILHEIETGESEPPSRSAESGEYRQPVVRLIDALLADAVARGASDLHFEPEAAFVRIRYRIDGVLRQIRSLHRTYWPAMVVRLKVIANMNIAETRAPQDGRLSRTLAGRPIDFRVASHPTTHGENIVLRVLDRQKGLVPLDALGLQADALAQLKLMIARPEGLILVTGPTGCGKTTTLYSILNFISHEGINVMTLEDPVEYPMPLIRQTSVNEAAKVDFANGIRALMRQDPDAILVGEIRDAETAGMAVRAAMTGHQVYSTLHSNTAVGAIPRLLDMGVPTDLLAGNLVGVIAQRLLRRLCPHCRMAYAPAAVERRLLGVYGEQVTTLYRAEGCAQCDFVGYRGRLAVMEVLRVDADLEAMIARRSPVRDIHGAACERGMRPLAVDALYRVFLGETSLDEVARVVDLTGRVNALPQEA